MAATAAALEVVRGGALARPAVVLIPGAGWSSLRMRPLQLALAASGRLHVAVWRYDVTHGDVATHGAALRNALVPYLPRSTRHPPPSPHGTRVNRLFPSPLQPTHQPDGNANDAIHFVTHGVGALVLRAALQPVHLPPNMGRVVQVCPPNRGSVLVHALMARDAYGRSGMPTLSRRVGYGVTSMAVAGLRGALGLGMLNDLCTLRAAATAAQGTTRGASYNNGDAAGNVDNVVAGLDPWPHHAYPLRIIAGAGTLTASLASACAQFAVAGSWGGGIGLDGGGSATGRGLGAHQHRLLRQQRGGGHDGMLGVGETLMVGNDGGGEAEVITVSTSHWAAPHNPVVMQHVLDFLLSQPPPPPPPRRDADERGRPAPSLK